jgi:hypothetical protein
LVLGYAKAEAEKERATQIKVALTAKRDQLDKKKHRNTRGLEEITSFLLR